MQERWAWHPQGASFPQDLAQAGHEPTSPPASLRFPPAMQPQQELGLILVFAFANQP